MKISTIQKRPVVLALAALALAGAATESQGAAFALQEQSASGLGNAFASGAASADDASAMWQNPAALSEFKRPQIVVGVHLITPSIKFQDSGSQPAAFQPLGGTGGDAGSTNVLPNLYVAVPLTEQWSFGLGINAPFGLVTEYDGDWLGRYQGVKSDVKTYNVNPAVSWKVNDQFSIGAGVSWQKIDATFTSKVNYSGAIAQAAGSAAAQGLIPASLVPSIIGATPGLDSSANIDGSDSAWGWNIGAMWHVTPATRLGLAYRSQIDYTVSGNASFDNPSVSVSPDLTPVVGLLTSTINSTALYNSGVTSKITLPAIVNASVFSSLNDRWDIMGDVQWTQWSKFKDLTFTRSTGTVLQSTPENFDDAWRVSVGANYKYNDAWKFRMGVAYDQTPVNDTDRTVRLPDQDRYWLAGGARWNLAQNLAFDFGAAYIWVKNADIYQNAGSTPSYGLVDGHFNFSVLVVSGQLVYSF
ncbi:MAG: outer membrane protein transport protein [Proteobacteria bacterium]|nr:outer membrane protein transport protein [Pseudomonadota bacterium]